MIGATKIAKNDKEKYVYSGYRKAFDGKSSWSFNHNFAGNVIIFGVDNSSSSYAYNLKKDFLILGQEGTIGINSSFGAPNKIPIDFSKAKTKICLSFHYNSGNSYLFVNEKKKKFKASNENNFSPQFCLGSISNKFDSDYLNEVSFKGNVYYFSVHYNSIDKSDTLNICKYFMIKNSI